MRVAVAENAATDDVTVELLLRDPVELVRLAGATNLAGRPALQAVVAHSDEKWMRAILAHTFARDDDRGLPYDVQILLSEDDFWETRQRIAETTAYAEIFEQLLLDADARVRGRCAANPRITLEQMERLVNDRSWIVRASAAGSGCRYPDDGQLLRLASDRSAGVRWAVVFRPDRPRAALELIAEDTDADNRDHARRALRDEHAIMSEQVIEWAREERRRADRIAPFIGAPR
ncbi:hypothetical protein BJ979_002857 [Schumannella luteola]|uniref:HEAT repeat domain-containing protein n=1 Tax=Schumannella luteola TaxID=472059 RepID=A0A852YGG2_9MICO|nr:hypothetical protein [Schumannella luteola]NYH00232.1 hypothetical protein [Schumannella luteola]